MTIARLRPIAALASLLAIGLAGPSRRAGQARTGQPPPSRRDSADKDYGAELPRFPMKSPAESLRAIVPRPGFRVELAAAEPLLRSPVAIDFDEDGRLYVAEFPEYNQYADARSRTAKGCVRLLEDTDGDGVYDKSTLFAADVPMATAVACWDGGVYVGSAPDLLYLKDTDGDGKADVRRVVFTGFGTDRRRRGDAELVPLGPRQPLPRLDQPRRRRRCRRGDRAAAKTVSVRGYGLLFDPRGETFELTGGGGQHGMSMDDWGRTYVCGNSDPFHLVMYDSRYLARNPYLQAPPAAVNVAPAGKFTKLYRISPVEPWRTLRTRLRSQGLVPGSDEGGSPSGFFTGATGVTVYRGDAFPAEFHGNLFVGDVANNIIHRAIAGAERRARDGPRAPSPAASSSPRATTFFRPVQMANGPDGCLWVIDMCRELIEGAAFLPPQILKHMDVASGVDRGRIWRIVPDGHTPRIAQAGQGDDGRAGRACWSTPTAGTATRRRGSFTSGRTGPPSSRCGGSPPDRSRPAGTNTRPRTRWPGWGRFEPGDVAGRAGDPEPRVREHALAAGGAVLPGRRADSRRGWRQMVGDPDPLVRYQLAFSLGALPGRRPAPRWPRWRSATGPIPGCAMAILSSVTACTGEVFQPAGRRRRLPVVGSTAAPS